MLFAFSSLTPISIYPRRDFAARAPQWAKQFAVILSRIARFDWPRHWPELFPGMLAAVQSSDPALVECVLGCMHQTLKELSLKRMQSDRNMFEQNALSLLPYVRQLWSAHVTALLAGLEAMDLSPHAAPVAADAAAAFDRSARLALLCIKSLRRLVVKGVNLPLEVPEATAFFRDLLPILQQLFAQRARLVAQV